MSLRLDPDRVTVTRPPGTVDDHGWAATGPVVAVGTLSGSLQGVRTSPSVAAQDGDDSGPAAPGTQARATLYLPEDADVRPGDTATINGTGWRVLSVTLVPDPTGGDLGCQVAEVVR